MARFYHAPWPAARPILDHVACVNTTKRGGERREVSFLETSAVIQRCRRWAEAQPAALRLAARLGRGRGQLRWLDRLHTPAPAVRPDLRNWEDRAFAAAWIGHATVLLRIAETTILTDPVFSNRIGIGLGLMTGGPGRLVAPALGVYELPPIDVVLVSHAHFDHLDRPSLARLPRKSRVITSAHNLDLLADLGFRSTRELRWGDSLQLGGVKITAWPVRHWGARTLYDHHRGFAAFLIEGGGRRVLYGGDTAFGDHFRQIGKVDLAILGIGGYDPYIHAHASPEQAWAMAEHVRAEAVLPLHHSTFVLSDEPVAEPLERIFTAAGNQSHRIIVSEIGGCWEADSP